MSGEAPPPYRSQLGQYRETSGYTEPINTKSQHKHYNININNNFINTKIK